VYALFNATGIFKDMLLSKTLVRTVLRVQGLSLPSEASLTVARVIRLVLACSCLHASSCLRLRQSVCLGLQECVQAP